MLRLLSFLLFLAGAVVLAYGGYQYMQPEPESSAMSAPAPQGSVGFDVGNSDPVASSPPAIARAMTSDMDEMFGVASSSTDDFMSTLRTVPIAHETPRGAQFGRPFSVTLSLDATGDDSATDSLPGTGNIVEGEAQISNTVQALVSGEAFSVEAITPATQRVSPLTENVWRWKVTPTAIGNQELVIEMFALMDGEALPLRTFRDSVDVKVSRVGQAIALAQSISPITVVAGGIGSMLAGLFGFVSFFRRR
ncbi:MAG: hypothetical protein ABJH52_05710 [Henriciella sp.]